MTHCSVHSEFKDSERCSGNFSKYKIRVITQPPGEGSFSIVRIITMCDAHKKLFSKSRNTGYATFSLDKVKGT